jgi:aminodeoxyfutalosine synthase
MGLTDINHSALRLVADRVLSGDRVNAAEGELLYKEAPLAWLATLADTVRQRMHGRTTWYNRNFHIEPTNRCIYNCRFCSYNERNSNTSWDYDLHTIAGLAREAPEGITEIHVVGGVAPERGTVYYARMLETIRKERPGVHLKAYSAIEISYMANLDSTSLKETLTRLKEAGLDSIPGGGAEIFAPEIRQKICPEKDDAERWLEVHETAHQLGIPTNATMLYGHIESYAHRIDHLMRLRSLQDRTKGFNAFIPLKFKHANNPMNFAGEVAATEDLRNYAVSRIFLDNIPHLKAYWPMIGRDIAQISQNFGVDDLDGTIHDSTRIYSAAGSGEQNPEMDVAQIEQLISEAGFTPVERDSMYQPVPKG